MRELNILCTRKIELDDSFGADITLKGKTKDYTGRLTLLTEKDVPRILSLEEKANIPPIRASREKILSRFSSGNMMLALEIEDEYISQQKKLIGDVGWRFAYFNPQEPEKLPANFDEYSSPSLLLPANFNTMFHYGINVDPQIRQEGLGREVLKQVFDGMFRLGKKIGCKYVVFDPRLHTYNGSREYPEIESFPQDSKMKSKVDRAIEGVEKFTIKEALRDPALSIYVRTLKSFRQEELRFIKLMPNSWFPPDKPSGGFGIYCYLELK